MDGTLLVVDVQNCFLNKFTGHVPGRIARLIDGSRFEPILFTRFVNVKDGPYHRFLDWHECEGPPGTDIAPELTTWAAPDRVFTKPGFTGLSAELTDRLRAERPERVVVVGIDTDMCVLKVAMDVFDLGLEPVVLIDCCASTAGLQAHLAGLAVLSRNIGPEQLRDAGLGDGRLGAPPEAVERAG